MRFSPGSPVAAFLGAFVVSVCSAQTAPAHHSPVKQPAPRAASGGPPEVIFFDGVIYTGEGLAEDKPQTVEAMAIGGGKILAVGTSAEITKLAGPNTRLRDINSANTSTFVFPGFNDAHVHLGSAGQ